MAEAVPQTLAMVNAAKARAIGNERRIFDLRCCSQASASNLRDQDLTDPGTANRMPSGT